MSTPIPVDGTDGAERPKRGSLASRLLRRKAREPRPAKAAREPRESRGKQKAERKPRSVVLAQYQRPRSRIIWIVLAAAVAAFCFVYGFFFSMYAPARMTQFGFPLLGLGAISVWALPELGRAPRKGIERLFFAFFVTVPLWPPYLAIALPGLPWITVARLIGFPLIFLVALGVSASKAFRKDIMEALNAAPLIWKTLVAFALLQLVSVGFSDQPNISVNKLLVAQVNWTAMFFAAVYVFRQPGRLERFGLLLWLMAIVLSFVGFREYTIHHVLWAGHVPSFLAVEDPAVQRLLHGSVRAGTDRYRVQGTYSSPLGFGEFLALSTPFVLHYIFGSYRFFLRVLAIIALPILLTAIISTDTRLSMVGFIASCVMYIFFWGTLRWRQTRGSIMGPAVVLSYPAVVMMVGAAVLFVPRLHVMTLGGGAQAASTEARKEQVRMGIPMLFHRPWGYGIGRGADKLGYTNGGGVLTIDTYWLLIALDYGVLGFLLFYGMILIAVGHGFFGIVAGPKSREQTLMIPITISLVVFFIIKSIYSGIENQSIIFMMLGAITALVFRQKADLDQVAPGTPGGLRPLGKQN